MELKVDKLLFQRLAVDVRSYQNHKSKLKCYEKYLHHQALEKPLVSEFMNPPSLNPTFIQRSDFLGLVVGSSVHRQSSTSAAHKMKRLTWLGDLHQTMHHCSPRNAADPNFQRCPERTWTTTRSSQLLIPPGRINKNKPISFIDAQHYKIHHMSWHIWWEKCKYTSPTANQTQWSVSICRRWVK